MSVGIRCDVCGWAISGVALHRLFPPATKYIGPVRLALKLSEEAEANHTCGLCFAKIIAVMPAEDLKQLVEMQAKALTKVENNLNLP